MLDLLVVMVRLSITTCEELSLILVEGWELPVAVEPIGMAAGPRLDATLKLSMPVMCIFKVEGLPVIKTWPLLPEMAERLLPTSRTLLERTYLSWLTGAHRGA